MSENKENEASAGKENSYPVSNLPFLDQDKMDGPLGWQSSIVIRSSEMIKVTIEDSVGILRVMRIHSDDLVLALDEYISKRDLKTFSIPLPIPAGEEKKQAEKPAVCRADGFDYIRASTFRVELKEEDRIKIASPIEGLGGI